MNRFARAALSGSWFLLRVGLLLGVAVAIGAWALMSTVNSEFRAAEVQVPDLRNLPESEAAALLQGSDLGMLVEARRPVEGTVPGSVAWQEPAAGAATRRHRMVKVVIATGENVAGLPNFIGRSRREAQVELKNLRAAAGQVIVVESSEKAEQVIAQSPLPGEPFTEGGKVDLLVSSGRRRPSFVMPDLRGRPAREVQAILSASGLSIASKREEYAAGPPGLVRSQAPPPGTRVFRDTPISVVVSRDAVPPSPGGGFNKEE